MSLNALWTRRTTIKSNGAPYIVQKAAAAVYTPEGQKEVRALVDFYMENARIIASGLAAAGFTVYGGRNAPYIWVRTPDGPLVLGLLRQGARPGERGGIARRGLRAERRGLLPPHRVRLAGADRGGRRADQEPALSAPPGRRPLPGRAERHSELGRHQDPAASPSDSGRTPAL